MLYMNSINSLLKIILYQYFLHSSRCIFYLSDNYSGTLNLPLGFQIVNIEVEQNENMSTISGKVFKNYGCQLFILNVENPAPLFSYIEQGLKLQNETFTKRSYIVIDNFNTSQSVLQIFETREINFVSNLLVIGLKLQFNNATFTITHTPDEVYYLWTHHYVGRRRNDVYELDEWFSVNQSFLRNADLFPDKLTDQNGRFCKIGFFEYLPYVIINKEAKSREYVIGGLEGNILREFFNRHNITLELFYVYKSYWGDVFDNGTVYGLRGVLYEDKVDIGAAAFFSTDRMYRYYGMTTPILRMGITCLVPAPKLVAGWLTPILVYSNCMWKFIFGGYVLIIFSIYFTDVGFHMNRLNYLRSNKYVLLLNKLEDIVFSICTQYLSNRNFARGISGAVYIGLSLFFTFFIFKSYESGLASIMTIPRYEDSISSTEDFLESNLSWGGIQISDWLMHWETDREERYRRAYRRYIAAPSEEILKELLAAGNFGLLIERLPEDHYHFPIPSVEQNKDIKLMRDDFHWEYSTLLLRKSSVLIPPLNKFILKINEAGITHRWLDEAAHLVMNHSTQKAIEDLKNYNNRVHQFSVLRLSHVAGVFGIVIAGNLLSILVFGCELLYHSHFEQGPRT